MADLNELQAAQSVKIIGTDLTGVESNAVNSSATGDLFVGDVLSLGTDTTLNLTTTAQEAKVGVSKLENRKYVILEALDTNVRWGFDTTCRFDIFKSQLIMIPAENATIYVKMQSGTGAVVVGECS